MDHVSFSDNGDTAGSCGAIHASNSTIRVDGSSSFRRNTASHGGAVCAYGGEVTVLPGAVFSSNVATESGGALWVGARALVNVTGGRFTNNTAEFGGAAAVESGGTAIISNCDMLMNTATSGSGGAAHIMGRAHIDGSNFEGNIAKLDSGGAVMVSGQLALLNADSCDFTGNMAKEAGGALRVDDKAQVELKHSNFSHNMATFGGAISVVRETNAYFYGGWMNHNNATERGGAIHTILEVSTVVGVRVKGWGRKVRVRFNVGTKPPSALSSAHPPTRHPPTRLL